MKKQRRRSIEEEQEEHIDESWLIPYADILTLLLALFIVLFAASSLNTSKYAAIMNALKSELTGTKVETSQKGLSSVPAKTSSQKKQLPAQKPATDINQAAKTAKDPELDKLMQKLQKYISDNHLQAVVTLQQSQRGVEVSLKDVILFDSGLAILKPQSFKTLDGIVGLINTVPNPISIEGHTDNVPIASSPFPSNWELSSARAASVLHYFQSKKIAPARMQFTGYGEYKPLYPNDTDAHRQANRRVTIAILKNN